MSERVVAIPERCSNPGVAWLPLVLGTTTALGVCGDLPRWGRMWLLAGTVFAGFKWLTFCAARSGGVKTTRRRSLEYLLLWPGMDARTFLDVTAGAKVPPMREWMVAAGKMFLGATLLWGVARFAGGGLTSGWIGMIGAILLLHFGSFHLLANFWRARGVCAKPLMAMPLAAKSVSEFWGRRWNVAFQEIAFATFFRSLRRCVPADWALMGTFFISGIIHDLVITIPAGAGYGLPTLYFSMQGVALVFEHRNRRWFRRHPGMNRAFAWLVVGAPAGLLFPPVFVERVILPFFAEIGAL